MFFITFMCAFDLFTLNMTLVLQVIYVLLCDEPFDSVMKFESDRWY